MKKYLGSGYSGTCYLTDDNKVIKTFKHNYISKLVDPRLFNIENDTYKFYKEGIYVEDKLVSVVMDYIEGKCLSDEDLVCKIDLFINGIPKVYEDTDSLSDKFISTNDVSPQNIIFNDSFKIIDVDFYDLYFDTSYIHEFNIANFNSAIYKYLFKRRITKPFAFISNDKELKELFYQTFKVNQDNKTLKEFLILLRKKLEERYECEINDTSELKSMIERARKKH